VILVTGGTGFVGARIVHALRAEDKPVRCLVRDPACADKLAAWGCELIEGDMTNPDSLRTAVAGCDTVVHLVAIIEGEASEYERIMVQGTRDLLAAARTARVRRFVLMSALGVSEETRELTPYFKSKWAMEQDVKASSLEWVIFRPSFVFGRDGGVLPTFFKLVRWMPAIPVIGPGTNRLQPIWIEDVASYFARAVDVPEATGHAFEIGGPDVVTWNELYDRIKRVLGKRRTKLHIPFGLMRANAALIELIPGPSPVTRDQITMLEAGDNVVTDDEARRVFGFDLVLLDEQLRRAA
jgi:uncharacterized protein YbjT (DUF2867 family)